VRCKKALVLIWRFMNLNVLIGFHEKGMYMVGRHSLIRVIIIEIYISLKADALPFDVCAYLFLFWLYYA
jgi:hypothetical protein